VFRFSFAVCTVQNDTFVNYVYNYPYPSIRSELTCVEYYDIHVLTNKCVYKFKYLWKLKENTIIFQFTLSKNLMNELKFFRYQLFTNNKKPYFLV